MTIPSNEELETMHFHICQAVGDTKRLKIMYALYEKPRYVTELAELLEAPQPTVSRHLAILLERSIVEKDRKGSIVVYRLVDRRIIDVMNQMRGIVAHILERKSAEETD